MDPKIRYLLACSLYLGLAACSGGGGGGGEPIIGGITLSTRALSVSRVSLAWTEPSDGSSVSPYVVARNDARSTSNVGSTSGLSFEVAQLEPDTEYCFVIEHPLFGYAMSNTACVRTPVDSSPPSIPGGLTATVVSPAEVDLKWEFSFDEHRVAVYDIYRDGRLIDSVSAIALTDRGATPGMTHCYGVTAFDPSGNESASSPQVCTNMPMDTEVPSVPTDVAATFSDGDGQPTIDVTWVASADNGVVRFYRVFRNGQYLADVEEATYQDLDLEAETSYCYTLLAVDAAGHESGQSGPGCARSSWRKTLVSAGTRFALVDIAIDSIDTPHIAFKTNTFIASTGDREVRLDYVALQAGQQPNLQRLETSAETFWIGDSQVLAIAVDNLNAAHIAHKVARGQLPEDIQHVQASSTPVQKTTIQQTDESTFSLSLASDSLGNLHACYTLGGAIVYANNTIGVWDPVDVGALVPGAEGSKCAIAIDGNDNAHISFIEAGTFDLMYLSNASGGWALERLDLSSQSTVSASFNTSIAVDENNSVHIAYFHDFTVLDLEYATNASGSWVASTIDAAGEAGYYCDIAVDRDGFVHIAYQDFTNDVTLEKYATNRSGAWTTGFLAAVEPGTSAIAVDSQNRVHVVYLDLDGVTYLTNRD